METNFSNVIFASALTVRLHADGVDQSLGKLGVAMIHAHKDGKDQVRSALLYDVSRVFYRAVSCCIMRTNDRSYK